MATARPSGAFRDVSSSEPQFGASGHSKMSSKFRGSLNFPEFPKGAATRRAYGMPANNCWRIVIVHKLTCGSCVALLACLCSANAQESFDLVSNDYVPEGKALRGPSSPTFEQCQTACGVDAKCKAFAFRISKRACYFYPVVYQGGSKRSRAMGLYSAGLAVVPKRGYVSGFKKSSFPPRPVFFNP
jgi:PAN domain